MGEMASAQHNPGGWRKSSYSMSNGQCVEAACLRPGRVALRDSVAPAGTVLHFEAEAWSSFLDEIRTSKSSVV
jgi:hypothetical protein